MVDQPGYPDANPESEYVCTYAAVVRFVGMRYNPEYECPSALKYVLPLYVFLAAPSKLVFAPDVDVPIVPMACFTTWQAILPSERKVASVTEVSCQLMGYDELKQPNTIAIPSAERVGKPDASTFVILVTAPPVELPVAR